MMHADPGSCEIPATVAGKAQRGDTKLVKRVGAVVVERTSPNRRGVVVRLYGDHCVLVRFPGYATERRRIGSLAPTNRAA